MRRSPMLSRIDFEPNDNAKTTAIPDARWPCWGCCISRLTNDISETISKLSRYFEEVLFSFGRRRSRLRILEIRDTADFATLNCIEYVVSWAAHT